MRGDGVENPQARVRGIARQQDHIHAPTAQQLVDAEQLGDEWESRAGRQRFVLVIDLIEAVGVQPLLAIDGVRIVEVEQRPRRDGDG